MTSTGRVTIYLEGRLFVPVLFGLSSIATILGAIFVVWQISVGQSFAAGMIALAFGVPVGFLSWNALKVGPRRLRVDVAGGTIDHIVDEQATSCALDQLGPLEIITYRRNSTRNNPEWHKLQAAGLPDVVLLQSLNRKVVEQLRDRLDRLIAQSAVRRVLAVASTGDSAFRGDPDLVSSLKQAVHDPARLRTALVAVSRDPDRDIGRKASGMIDRIG
jgi:hypothetical protein